MSRKNKQRTRSIPVSKKTICFQHTLSIDTLDYILDFDPDTLAVTCYISEYGQDSKLTLGTFKRSQGFFAFNLYSMGQFEESTRNKIKNWINSPDSEIKRFFKGVQNDRPYIKPNVRTAIAKKQSRHCKAVTDSKQTYGSHDQRLALAARIKARKQARKIAA